MSSLVEQIKAKAKADVKHILLPEGTEERTVQAAAKIRDQGIAKLTLFGKPEEVKTNKQVIEAYLGEEDD